MLYLPKNSLKFVDNFFISCRQTNTQRQETSSYSHTLICTLNHETQQFVSWTLFCCTQAFKWMTLLLINFF